MSNYAFDRLCRAQDITNTRKTIANMEAHLATGKATDAERDYASRSLPTERERLAWLLAN